MKVIAVLALYNCTPQDSITLNALSSNYLNNKKYFTSFKLIIYDNGAVNQKEKVSLPFDYFYEHDPSNNGLIKAYNFALNDGIQNTYNWLLLLDQDSSLPENFIASLFQNLFTVEEITNVKAVVPKMYGRGKVYSPSRVLYGGFHRPVERNFTGVYTGGELCPIGSGSALRISFFKEIYGFKCIFKLDSLDRWIYNTIYKNGGKVFVTSTFVEHELSVMDYSKYMNLERYQSVIKYETFFMKLYRTRGENIIYYLRLFVRALSFLKNKKTMKFAVPTFYHIVYVMFKSKKNILKNKKEHIKYNDN